MIKVSSKNYDFYFNIGSLAEKDIDNIIKIQEKCYTDICNVLNIKPKLRIKYYLLETPELVGKAYGDNEPCNGFASPPDTIYAVYNKDVKCIGYHEDAHIISYTINRPDSPFIREGLAMFFDKVWWNRKNEDWVIEYLKNNKYISIVKLLDKDTFFSYPDHVTYPIAGSFIKFLIEKFGINKFLELYKKNSNYIKHIEDIYGIKIYDIESEYKQLVLKL